MTQKPGFCTGCGARLEPDMRFCETCGQPVAAVCTTAPPATPSTEAPPPATTPPGVAQAPAKRVALAVIAGVAIVAVAVVTMLVTRSPTRPDTTTAGVTPSATVPGATNTVQPVALVGQSEKTLAPTNTAQPPTLPPSATVAATRTASPHPQSTAPAAASELMSVDQGGVRFAYDLGLAKNVTFESKPALEEMGLVYPAHRSYRLEGYPVMRANEGMPAEISVFSVAEYTKESQFAAAADELATLFASGQAALTTNVNMPLPLLSSAARLGQTRLSLLAFTQGSGIRYLTQYAQAMWPFTNPFHYHFVGLTSDGQYYVEVTFLVNASILRDQPQINKADGEEVREFNRKIERQLWELEASEFEPNLDRLDDLVRSIVVSAPSQEVATPTSPVAASTQGVRIIQFTVAPEAVYPGDTVTLTWELEGDVGQVSLYTMEQWGSLSAPLGSFTGRTGTAQVATNPDLRGSQDFTLFVTAEGTEGTAYDVRAEGTLDSACTSVSLLCPDPWLFPNPPQDQCPIWTVRTLIVRQRFERGWLLWTEADNNIYVLPDGGTWTDCEDLWQEGMPESDSSIVPPQGFLQPVRGFGLLWRQGEVYVSYKEGWVRDFLGWATEPEQVVGDGFVQQAFTYGKHTLGGDRFMTGPQGNVLHLPQGLQRFTWSIWEG